MSALEELDNCDPPNRVQGEDGQKNKTLLLSGGTGFLGKAFIENLLRTCPMVNKVYVLIRTKKGKDPQARLKEMFTNPVFSLLKKLRGEEILKKVIAISGDLQEPALGLAPEDRKLLTEEVQYVYHLAATTRFDEPFKRAVLFNTRGTKFMLELAKECKQLLLFIHCSTAYCFPHEEILYEKAYPPPADPDLIIQVCEMLSDEAVDAMAKILMRDCPNTYTYSKALAEGLVTREMENMPINILRPSVVIPMWKEPLPGWTDNLYGPTGLLVAAGKGILRTMYCNPQGYVDFVPVDCVACILVGTPWDYMTNKKCRIYNLTTTSEIKATWEEVIELGKDIALKDMPLNWVVWYPGGSMKKSKLLHQICVVLFHYIPAIFLDTLIVLTGNKPVVWRIQRKISAGFDLFEFYANRKWEFNNDEGRKSREQMNETEKRIYKIHKDGLDLREYFYNATHGARLYVLKEGDETLPTARRHIKIMWAVDRIVKLLMLIGFVYLIYTYILNPFLEA